MNIRYSFKTAISSLKTNKVRSFLTILGIVIGVTATILIMSIGEGAEGLILNQIGGMGADIVVIRPGKEPSGPSDMADTLFADSLKPRDVEALKRKNNVPDLVDITPIVIVSGSASYKRETYRPTIFGSDAEFMGKMMNLHPEEGAFFDEDDIKSIANVALIGSKVREELFGEENPIGKNIKIKDKSFRITSYLPAHGQTTFFNPDEMILLPYTTARLRLAGINHYHEIVTRASSPEAVDRMIQDIKMTLREQHKLSPTDKDDFFVVSQQGLVDQVKTITSALTIFLSSVVAISLIVGGIGVMNIMLVSVTERTREIGLRKSLGATKKDILLQFLFESMSLTATGGVISIILGALLSYATAFILTNFANLDWQFSFPVSAVAMGLGVATSVGLIFGIYPARQAAEKSPIEALRYE